MAGKFPQPDEVGDMYAETTSLDGQWSQGHISEKVVVSSGVANVTLGQTIPAFSRVEAVYVKCQEIGGITTGTHLALGTASDPDQLFEVTFTGIDAVDDEIMQVPDTAMFAATAQTLKLASTNGSGAAAGTLDDGTWAVVVWYTTYPTIDDA